ncbi:MAG TPA: hypothetical protein VM076_14500 [Gemmatimonadaceae bacterium]|nr:hypothetical protein [Gemmatimonadaceae bacterium]
MPNADGAVVPNQGKLVVVKIAHTVVWALLVACIVGIPVAAWQEHFGWAAALGAIIVVEGVVLIANGWRCPLTDLAARYTHDRRDNFDIYLPLWLARHNKTIFTTIFVGAVVFSVVQWARWAR